MSPLYPRIADEDDDKRIASWEAMHLVTFLDVLLAPGLENEFKA
jgi:hypothetical protein